MKPSKETKCDVCATPDFERNNYYYGKQFTVRGLLQEQCYLNDKRRLINRMVLGWGVICGLDVRWVPESRKFVVENGLALDCCGNELLVCEPQHVPFKQYEELCECAPKEGESPTGRFVLCLEYAECKTEPVELPPLTCENHAREEYNLIRDGFKLRIKKWEEACPKQPFGHIECLDRFKFDSTDLHHPRICHTEPIHEYLCCLSKKGWPACECCECVVLATIDLTYEEKKPPKPGAEQTADPSQQAHREQRTKQGEPKVTVDPCSDRRLVYRNPLLYDLIYCHHGDLPHIVDFSWRPKTSVNREVEWNDLLDMMDEKAAQPSPPTVFFDKDMESASLNEHSFYLSFLHKEEGTGHFFEKRIPGKVVSGKTGDCYTATFVADQDWVKDELNSKNSQLAAGVDVEITLRGSHIRSVDGKALDGEFLSGRLPTGNGVQGGDFVDWFRVLKREPKSAAKAIDF